MRALDVITTKRDGHRLSDDQIDWFISTYSSSDSIADEQAAALAMAIFLNGMDSGELARWTKAMIDSGDRLDLSAIDRPTVDKHSTGGVGDKISLILVPLVAACGAAVPQLSGRGLGHTGGTLDKMEAIPGWSARLTPEQMIAQLNTVGGVIAGASENLAPADRKLYALRDVTGTVESIPLIASSIMSKKIAEGAEALCLDVMVGSGAFMNDEEQGIELANAMAELGAAHGVRTSALVIRMDRVLGRTAGNALEVQEAFDVLAGHGPSDVVEVTLALANEMVSLAGLDADPAAVLASGAALDTFHEMVEAQGGDLSKGLPLAEHQRTVYAPASGFFNGAEARAIGVAAWRLGAGRARKEDPVSPTAGVRFLVEKGAEITKGQQLLELHADDAALFDHVVESVEQSLLISPTPQPQPSPVIKRISP